MGWFIQWMDQPIFKMRLGAPDLPFGEKMAQAGWLLPDGKLKSFFPKGEWTHSYKEVWFPT